MNGRHRSSLLGMSWLILQASMSFAADWPAYLNGNDRVGFSSAALSPGLHLSWIYRTPARPEIAFSGPRNTPIEGHVMLHRVNFDAAMNVVHGNSRSYFGSTVDHRVYCVDSNTGKTVWSFYTDGPIRLAPTLAHGNAYFGSDDGKVYCLNAETGEVVWQMRVGPKDDRLRSRGEMIARWPVRTGVLIDGDTAYFGAGIFPHETIYLCAVKAKTGEIVWKNDRISQQDAGRNELSPQGYLLCNEEYLYVPSGRSLPVAVSKVTGEIVFQRKHSWRADAGGVVGGTKALLGDGQVYSGGPHHFLAMVEKTGDVGAAFIGGRQMVLADEYAYLLDGSKIFCVNRAEHAQASQEKQKWLLKSAKVRNDPEQFQETQQKIEEYAGVGIVWEFPSEHDDALIATNKLVIAGGMNQVTVLDRATGKKLFETPVEVNVMGLSATDSLLTVSTDSGHIYGFGTKAVDAVQEWPEPFSAAFATDELTDHFQRTAAEIIERSGQRTGFCLVEGSEDGRAYVAYDNGQLFCTSTIRQELEEKLRRRGLTVKSQTDAIFGVDTKTGQFLWTYRGTNILHTTIAIGPKTVYFIDSSLTPEQRQDLYRRDKPELQNLTGEEALKAEEEMKKLDVRLAVAIDRTTGKKLWEKTVNVTDTTDVSAGGGNLTVMYADGHLLLCGANANGHYWKQFMAGEFKTRKLLVLDAKSGEEKWSTNANYMNRPAVVEGQIYVEPWAFELQTGKEKTRIHPLTGEETPWQYSRPGHHCGVITATPNMMFFRSGFIGYYDLYEDSGTRHFAGQRLGCWVNAIPGNGLVMIPEASAGCVCQFSIASTVVLEPKTENKSWGILSAVGDTTPVQRIGINFGAPGDRKDTVQKAWFGFPRPMSVNRLEFVFDIQPQLAEGGGWYSHNPDAVQVESDDASWLFASGARGLEHFEIPLLGAEDEPTSYDVRMFFTDISPMELNGVKVSFQGQELSGETQSNGSDSSQTQALVEKVYSIVRVEKNLVVDVKWPADKPQPTIAAIEVIHHE